MNWTRLLSFLLMSVWLGIGSQLALAQRSALPQPEVKNFPALEEAETPAFRVTGTILNPDGDPVEGATIR